MRDYRLYCLDDDGKFTKAHEISARDDCEALQIARDMKLSVNCELWERERRVAQLEAKCA